MKTQNIIVLNNHRNGIKAVVVQNFSDTNVKEAIEKLIQVSPDILQCRSSSMSHGIYVVTKVVRSLKDEISPIYGLNDEEGCEILLDISYATLYL